MRLVILHILLLLFVFSAKLSQAQTITDSVATIIDLDEIVVIQEYPYKNKREEKKYRQLEQDLRKIYPVIVIIRSEYKRINEELLAFYDSDEKKEDDFMKWYENYARENYMLYLSGLNVRQGRLLLKLISRELDHTPYQLIKTYRNGFRAVLWQGTAYLFLANLKSDYDADNEPMIEHIMQKIDMENNINY